MRVWLVRDLTQKSPDETKSVTIVIEVATMQESAALGVDHDLANDLLVEATETVQTREIEVVVMTVVDLRRDIEEEAKIEMIEEETTLQDVTTREIVINAHPLGEDRTKRTTDVSLT